MYSGSERSSESSEGEEEEEEDQGEEEEEEDNKKHPGKFLARLFSHIRSGFPLFLPMCLTGVTALWSLSKTHLS